MKRNSAWIFGALLALPLSAAAEPTGTALDYPGFADAAGLSLNGAANVADDGSLVLTPSRDWTSGSAFASEPLSMKTFSTAFAFQIDRPGGGGADGIAFIAQTVSASLGDLGGGMGYEGTRQSLAIEVDTWRNGWDPDGNHAGLLIDGDVTHRDFAAVPLDDPLEDDAPWFAWIDYDGAKISLRLARTSERPETAVFTHAIDVPAVLNADDAWIGFAAATGAARARHRILDWIYAERHDPALTDGIEMGSAVAPAKE